jgi:hypothetical protein
LDHWGVLFSEPENADPGFLPTGEGGFTMNKFLMMSAAAVMGGMVTGVCPEATAGTFAGTVFFYKSAAGTARYCDFMKIFHNPAGSNWTAQHFYSTCGTNLTLPDVGSLINFHVGAKRYRGIGLADISGPYFGIAVSEEWYFSLPLLRHNRRGARLSVVAVLGSTTGLTSFPVNLAFQGPTHGQNGNTGKTAGMLDSVLGNKPKQQ